MYKILLVDDEKNIRDGISRNIKWNELGFDLIGSCENGLDALEIIENNEPDVVLTDICMPFMDGIELSESILEIYPSTKVIILTGHDKFEYVQKAIKLKANDFLLKPIMPIELSSILSKVKNELDEEKLKIQSINYIKKQLDSSIPIRKERFLNRLVSKSLEESEIKEKMSNLKITLSGTHYVSIVIDIDKAERDLMSHQEKEIALLAINNACTSILKNVDDSIVFENYNEKLVILFSGESEDNLNEIIQLASEKIADSIIKRLNIKISIGLGGIVEYLKDLHLSYEEAKQALSYRFLLGQNIVISIKDIKKKDSKDRINSKYSVKELYKVTKIGTADEINEVIDKLFLTLPNYCNTIDEYYIHVQNYIITILLALDEQGIEYNKILDDKTSPFLDIYNYHTLDLIKEWLKKFCLEIAKYMNDDQNNYHHLQAVKAQEYIQQNYNTIGLSLKMVCKELHMSSSYFSAVFKENYKMTFVEYLTELRMIEAKKLLKTTQMKNYEIAHSVGYNDPHYFSLIFKKYTGMTCTDYKTKVSGD